MRVIPFLLVAASALSAQDFNPYLKAQEEVNEFSGTVLVAKDGKVILRRAVGLANREWNVPMTPDSKLRLGSITKQFTATAILLLEKNGKLKVEDTLDKHVPDCPEAWKKVTIHHLLTHTAGVPSYTDDPQYRAYKVKTTPPADLIALFRNKPLEFEPGERMKYSNSGYSLLGYIIEKVAGESYESYLRKNIFIPLGMTNTGYDHGELILPMRVAGYSKRSGTMRNSNYLDMSIPFSAGSLYSTIDDLYTWQQALFGGKVLPADVVTRMTTAVKNNYGYGLTMTENRGRKVIGHGGGIDGFSTMIMHMPEQKAQVIVLSNVEDVNAGRVAIDISAILFGDAVELPKKRIEISLPADTLQKYTGVYALTPTFKMTVRREGTQLVTQATGQGSVPIFPESETKFFVKVIDAQITFVKSPDGKIDELILHQGGRNMPAKRVE